MHLADGNSKWPPALCQLTDISLFTLLLTQCRCCSTSGHPASAAANLMVWNSSKLWPAVVKKPSSVSFPSRIHLILIHLHWYRHCWLHVIMWRCCYKLYTSTGIWKPVQWQQCPFHQQSGYGSRRDDANGWYCLVRGEQWALWHYWWGDRNSTHPVRTRVLLVSNMACWCNS